MKQTPIEKPNTGSLETKIQSFETSLKKLNFQELEILAQKVQYLGKHFDPFELSINQECQNILNHLEIDTLRDDPFKFTNFLLQLLDKLEAELKLKKH